MVFRCLLALPLLPVADIGPAFEEVKALVTTESATRTLLDQLCRYVERQWISKSTIGASRMSVRDNTSRTNNAVESFHAALQRRRVKVAHPSLFSFLGHLQRTTVDNATEVARLNRGLSIRRAKKRVNMVNDARIRACMSRYDSGAYTRLQFLKAMSHCIGAHAMCDESISTHSCDEGDVSDNEVRDPPPSADVEPQSDELCEVCLVKQRDGRLALVPCGHQRFCSDCIEQVERQGHGCPICRSPINLVLRLY